MNKRQRNKRIKKIHQRMSDYLRDALKPMIGQPVDEMTKNKVGPWSPTTSSMMSRLLFISQVFLVAPIVHEPYRQWRALGREQLTHSAGINTRDGIDHWMRFCDYESVDAECILSHEVTVNCLQCIAREGEVRANANTHQ